LRRVSEKALSGGRLTAEEALRLFRSDDIFTIGRLASYAAERKNGKNAYFIRNLHINPTNICINRCSFCAFSRSKGEAGAFEMTTDEILGAIKAAGPVREVHIVGGLHPEWPFEHYLEMLRLIRKTFPELGIKAFTATEVDHMQRRSGLSLDAALEALKGAGLDIMPGGGAEIFARRVRQRLCPEKLSGQRWLEVMEAAHKAGIKSNATMLYGHIEGYEDRVEHLLRLRALQDRTGGFQAFIPLPYIGGPMTPNSPVSAYTRTGGLDDLKTIALSRLLLDNIPHIKAYWVMLGERLSQLALLWGADDLEGTVINEKIARAADPENKKGLTADELIHLIKKAGKEPVERDSFYRPI